MTKEITLPSGRYLLVKCALGLEPIVIDNNSAMHGKSVVCNEVSKERLAWIQIPSNNTCTLIGKADQLTEDQWKGIVEILYENVRIEYDVLEGYIYGNIYKDYAQIEQLNYEAKESGLSLLKAHGFEIDTTLILKID